MTAKQIEKAYQKRVKAIQALPDNTMFYWQSYGYVGNLLNLWRIGNAGYTTDIEEAQKYTKEQTLGQLACRRDQDDFWLVDDLIPAAKLTVDHQNVKGKRY